MTVTEQLLDKLYNKTANMCVVGLGYVGLPLAVEMALKGFNVVGVDINEDRCQRVNAGDSYIIDIPSDLLSSVVKSGRLRATTDYSVVGGVDTVNICVPTPLNKTKDPDMSYIAHVCGHIEQYIHSGMLIILESTSYPGTTEEFILPLFKKKGLEVGRDFHLCFSPERVDPGNEHYQTKNIPKVVGGVTTGCTTVGVEFYSQILQNVVPVSSPRVAEMVKLLENTFRLINIGLVNEMATMCHYMGIDVWEVIKAASTKPFGFMPFYPGPGLGGHCIPIDPFYLSWKSKEFGREFKFIEVAGQVNHEMPRFVVSRIQDALNDQRRSLNGARILIVGVAYKKNIDDVRESPALDIIHMLQEKGAVVNYHDPFVSSIRMGDGVMNSCDLTTAETSDIVVIITDHSGVDYQYLAENATTVFDTRNAMRDYINQASATARIIRL